MDWVTPNVLISMCFASFLLGVIAMLLLDISINKRMHRGNKKE